MRVPAGPVVDGRRPHPGGTGHFLPRQRVVRACCHRSSPRCRDLIRSDSRRVRASLLTTQARNRSRSNTTAIAASPPPPSTASIVCAASLFGGDHRDHRLRCLPRGRRDSRRCRSGCRRGVVGRRQDRWWQVHERRRVAQRSYSTICFSIFRQRSWLPVVDRRVRGTPCLAFGVEAGRSVDVVAWQRHLSGNRDCRLSGCDGQSSLSNEGDNEGCPRLRLRAGVVPPVGPFWKRAPCGVGNCCCRVWVISVVEWSRVQRWTHLGGTGCRAVSVREPSPWTILRS